MKQPNTFMEIENQSLIQIKIFNFFKHHFIDLLVDGFDRISKNLAYFSTIQKNFFLQKKSNKAFLTSLTLDKNHLLSPQSFVLYS